MFEAQIAYYLNEYLGTYVEGIDRESLTISIYKGDVTLKNLQLKANALDDFDLPVEVQAGLLGSLTLKVPWNNLGGTPVVVTIDQLYLLARPKEDEYGSEYQEEMSKHDFERAYQRFKQKRVERQESTWTKGLERMHQKEREQVDNKKRGFLRGLIDTVIGNLQFSISNVHVRYEDPYTRPGHVFACGFTLQKLSAFTVDEIGKKTFVSSNAMDVLRKSLQLKRIAVYFDCDVSQWEPMEHWHDMENETWQEWFHPDIVGTSASPRSYVLQPVDGRAMYIRRGSHANPEEDPATDLNVTLDDVTVSLSREQYCNYSLLLSEVSKFTSRLPYAGYHPKGRPAPGNRAKAWWYYAVLTVRQNSENKSLKWLQLVKFVLRRDKYTSLYKNILQMKDFRRRKDIEIPKDVHDRFRHELKVLKEMDESLPENTIIMLRRMAYLEYDKQKEKERVEAEKNRQNRGWLGWLMGGTQQSGADTSQLGQSSALLEQKSNLSPEEYNTVLNALEKQEENMRLKFETPYTMLTRFSIHVGSASAVLVENTQELLLKGSLSGINSEVIVYPKTQVTSIDIASMGMDCKAGALVQTGTGDKSGQHTELFEQAQIMLGNEGALALRFVKQPQDNSADAVLNLQLAPSFVYYNPETVKSVVEFFKPPEDFHLQDLTELTLAASAQIERARRLAAEYAVAAWSEKPRLSMKLYLSAPKIAIPATFGGKDVSLGIDLGSFLIQSDQQAVTSLAPEQRGLYECIQLSGRNLYAFLKDDKINWADDGSERETAGTTFTLLDLCGIDLGVQFARYKDARYPAIRLFPSVPKLNFFLSPERISRMMQILRFVNPTNAEDDSASIREQSSSSWRDMAEWEGAAQVLEWSGFQSSATWCLHRLVVYHGKLYVASTANPDEIQRVVPIESNYMIKRVPESLLGLQNLILVHSISDESWKTLIMDRKSVLLRLDTAQACDRLREALVSATHEASLTLSETSTQVEESNDSIEEIFDVPFVEVRSSLAEMRILVSGREPKVWNRQSTSMEEERMRDNAETDLVVLKTSGGALDIDYGANEISVRTSLVALEIEDLLMGTLDPNKKFLASSILISQLIPNQGDSLRGKEVSRRSEGSNLAEFAFTMRSPEHPLYASVDAKLSMELQCLQFYCNRPTVASLMAFGNDLSAAFSAGDQQNLATEQTPGNPLATEVLVFCEDSSKISFDLHISMKELHLVLNYEDKTSPGLSLASMTGFEFGLQTMSDGRMMIQTSLENLLMDDLTLEDKSPYKQICGLRTGSSDSLINVSFDFYPARVSKSIRVPTNLDSYYLRAHLSKLKVTFLYKFLREFLDYISLMLLLKPEPLLENIGTSQEMNKDEPSLQLLSSQIESQVFILAMDVSLDAPIIILPSSSHEDNFIQLDLGNLDVKSQVDQVSGSNETENLIESASLTLSGINCYLCSQGEKGNSVVQQSEKGWILKWQRCLDVNHDSSLPNFELDVSIPLLRAILSNIEYEMLISVASRNFGEEFELPEEVQWIKAKYEAVGEETPQNDLTPRGSLAIKDTLEYLASPRASAPQRSSAICTFRAVVNLGSLELILKKTEDRSKPADPLAKLRIDSLFVSFLSFEEGTIQVDVVIPRLEVSDVRPQVAIGEFLVISSAHKASFMMLHYKSEPSSQHIDLIFQKPLFVAELGFLLSLTKFFVPSFEFIKSDPLPFSSFDFLLKESECKLQEDLWLSPACRLIADSHATTYTLDGKGHSLILPPVADLAEQVPLIIIGTNCTLKMTNIRINGASALGACLKLNPGARLITETNDGVSMESDSKFEDINRTLDTPNTSKVEGAPSSFQMSVAASGFGLQLMKLDEISSGKKTFASDSVDQIHVIAFKMDIDAKYASDIDQQEVQVKISGMRASSRTVSNIEEEMAQRATAALSSHRKITGEKDNDIILPASVQAAYASSKGEMDFKCKVSQLQVLLSPGILELMTHLAQDALAPLQQPGPDDPVQAVSKYTKIASLSQENGAQGTRQFSRAFLQRDRVVNFWRPTCKTGYFSAGDILTFGDCAPQFEILSVALNSGLVLHPNSYRLVAKSGSLRFWKPVPPEGFRSIGCLVSTSESQPSVMDSVCIHEDVLIECPIGESEIHKAMTEGDQDYELWCVDNSFGTFDACSAHNPDLKGYDIRNPVGITPASLIKHKYIEHAELGKSSRPSTELSKRLSMDFMAAQRKGKSDKSQTIFCPKIVDFKRIWTDNGAFSDGQGVTIWRPIPPLGYSILGDCFCKGFDPPTSVHVLKDANSILADPLRFEIAWSDGNPKVDLRACIWMPVAPNGYVSLGAVASIGAIRPNVEVKCIREDLVAPSPVARRPLWRVPEGQQFIQPVSIWQADEHLGTFAVSSLDLNRPPSDLKQANIKLLDKNVEEEQGDIVNMVIGIEGVGVHLFDSFNLPLIKAELHSIESGAKGYSSNALQCYIGFRPSIQAFNRAAKYWEPIVEPFDCIGKADCNFTQRNQSGIDPGVHVNIKSSSELILGTVAVSHANSIIAAYTEWVSSSQVATFGTALSKELKRNDALQYRVENNLGATLILETEYTGELLSFEIEHGANVIIQRELGTSGQEEQTDSLPNRLWMLDVDRLICPGLAKKRVFVALRLDCGDLDAFSPRTRATASVTTSGTFNFHERLLLSLPDNQDDIKVLIEIWDADAKAGMGRCFAMGSFSYSYLKEEYVDVGKLTISGAENDVDLYVTVTLQDQVKPKFGYGRTARNKQETSQRALCIVLPGTQSSWAVIPDTLHMKFHHISRNKGIFESVSAIEYGEHDIVIEGYIDQGLWCEKIRSNCSVVNSTAYKLQIGSVMSKSGQFGIQKSVRVVGEISPGEILCLPLGWQFDTILTFLPNLISETHEWSYDISRAAPGISLEELAGSSSNFSALLECVPQTKTGESAPTALSIMSFIVHVDRENLSGGKVRDWTITIKPPLIIKNETPVSFSMRVNEMWGDSDLTRVSEEIQAGGELSIYTLDMKRQIGFKMESADFVWAEESSAPLFYGAGSQQVSLPDSVKLRQAESDSSVDIYIDRTLNPLNRQQSISESLVRGSSLVVVLFAPLWVLNATELSVYAALIPAPQRIKREKVHEDFSRQSASIYQATLYASEALTDQGVACQQRVQSHSMELLSYSPSATLDSRAQNSGFAIQVKVQDSGWTPALLVDCDADKPLVNNLGSSRPFLVRAESRQDGLTYEVVLRLEMTEFNSSRMLRIDTRVIMDNRTGLDLEACLCNIDRSSLRLGHYSGILLPEGGMQFTFEEESRHISSDALSVASRESSWQERDELNLGSKSFVQMPDNLSKKFKEQKRYLNLPSGMVGKPVHLAKGLNEHVLCFRHNLETVSSASTLWSRPMVLGMSQEGEQFYVVPTYADVPNMLSRPLLLRLRTRSRGLGLVQVTIESTSCMPPYLIENRSSIEISYRQLGWEGAPVHKVPPFSCIGYASELTVEDDWRKVAVEMFKEGFDAYAQEFLLDSNESDLLTSDQLTVSSTQVCTVRSSIEEYVIATPSGLRRISGDAKSYSLGKGGVSRILQVSDDSRAVLQHRMSDLSADLYCHVVIPGLSLSMVDSVPEEIVLLTLSSITFDLSIMHVPNGVAHTVQLNVSSIQLDDQLAGTKLPVTICPVLGSSQKQPIFSFFSSRLNPYFRSPIVFPYVSFRIGSEIQFAVNECLLWRLLAVHESFTGIQEQAAMGENTLRTTDAMVRVRLFCLGDSQLSVSFINDPTSRPRSFARGAIGLAMDLATFQAAKVTLKGFEVQNLSLTQSRLLERFVQRLRGDLMGVVFSLLRNFSVVGGASKIFGALGAKMAKIAGEGKQNSAIDDAQIPNIGASSQRKISDIGDGLLEGAGTFGNSVLKGFRGLVNKPVEGARRTGFHGAMKGMAKGLVGAFASPVSGALDALSATAEGIDASFGKNRASVLVLQRKRLPRVIYADGKIHPLTRHGTEKEAVLESLGQAFLRSTLLGAGIYAPSMNLETYEEHFVLPNDNVLIFTNVSMIHIFAPGFAQLDGAAEIGSLPGIEIPPGKMDWRVFWTDVLAIELKWGDSNSPPDKLVLHRKGSELEAGKSPQRQKGKKSTAVETPLAFQVVCFPATPQASQIKFVASSLIGKYYQDQARQDQRWTERHAARATLVAGQSFQDLPMTMPCIEFVPTWNSNPARSPVVYFWTPIAPAGYKPVGDVITLGPDPPAQPVECYRDDVTLSRSDANDLITAFPEEYTLIWRYNGTRSVTMWMPVPPKGYVALGAVVLNTIEVPSLDNYVCLRQDLVKSSVVYDTSMWSYDPEMVRVEATQKASQSTSTNNSFRTSAGPAVSVIAAAVPNSYMPENWKVSVWPVDNQLRTFLVVRGLKKPPASLAYEV